MDFHLLAGITVIFFLIVVCASREGLRAWRTRYARVQRNDMPRRHRDGGD